MTTESIIGKAKDLIKAIETNTSKEGILELEAIAEELKVLKNWVNSSTLEKREIN